MANLLHAITVRVAADCAAAALRVSDGGPHHVFAASVAIDADLRDELPAGFLLPARR